LLLFLATTSTSTSLSLSFWNEPSPESSPSWDPSSE
jgi:hypothetical protein